MKKIILITLIVIVVLIITGKVNTKKGDNNGSEGTFKTPKPPVVDTVTNPSSNQEGGSKPFYTNEGEGLDAVNATMDSIYNNYYEMFAYGIETDLYSGLKHKAGVKAAMVDIFSNSNNIPLIPSFINPSVKRQMKEVIDAIGFEEMTGMNNRETDNVIPYWQSMIDFGSFSLWPINIKEMIEAEYFGKPKKGDRNRSERYDAFINDIKVLAKNYIRAIDELETSIRSEAIKRLRSAGWIFIDVV